MNPPSTLLSICCLILSVVGCSSLVDESSVAVDASITSDASVTVPDAVSSYDCYPSPREQMGASPDTTATFQIWLDGTQLYTCHGAQYPHCQGFGGSPVVYSCTTAQLSGGA